MDAVAIQDQGALRARLAQARERLAGLVRDLRSLDAELEALSTERRQHRLLQTAWTALEELRAEGAAGLFWGDRASAGQGDEQMRLARGRLDAFEKRVGEIEDRREAVLEEIGRAEEGAEILEDDVLEEQRQEEERRLEWIPEREVGALPLRELVMPWSRGGEEDERFRRALSASLLFSLLLGLVIPMIDLPLPDRLEPIEVPERLTRLIQERPLPPPPPRQEETRPEEVEPEEAPLLAETPPAQAPPQAEPQETGSKGILAFREKFSGLAESQPEARLGAQARISHSDGAPSGLPQRSMVTTQAPGSSGGINLAALSRDLGGAGGQGIEGVQVARATSSIGSIGPGERPLSNGPGPSRTDEEIQIVFDRHKAALYRLYNRELRRDPTLQGQMVLRLTIEPDGRVSLCALHATDMQAPELSAQVLERVRTFDFGAKEGIAAITILYPIDFLPAA